MVGTPASSAARHRPGCSATRDAEAVLALAPDCVCHCPRNTKETTDEVAMILERGINVVSSVLLPALYPAAMYVSSRSTAAARASVRAR